MAAATLVLFFGAWVLIDGIFRVIGSVGHRASDPDWGWQLVIGLLGIIIGLLTFHASGCYGAGSGDLHCGMGTHDWRDRNCAGNQDAPRNQGRMVTHSYGFGFNRLRGSPIVESRRRSSGADLDHRVVRGDNRGAGKYFCLSLAELAHPAHPLIGSKPFAILCYPGGSLGLSHH